ncbi:MAG: DUF4157 domain-containing protein [Steroidobacteraceae bacterium]
MTASHNLRIGSPNDVLEREADAFADSIVAGGNSTSVWSFARMGVERRIQRKCACGGTSKCDACGGTKPSHQDGDKPIDREEESVLQRKAGNSGAEEFAPSSVEDVIRSGGTPLDLKTRRFFESRFAHDFSRVRVHTDNQAAQSARAVNALAYTVGNHVVFGAGKYVPDSSGGRHLLAHELAHTVQQSRGGSSGGWSTAATAERQADQAAKESAAEGGTVTVEGVTRRSLARAPDPSLPLPALTPEELIQRLVMDVRGFASSEPGIPDFDPDAPGAAMGRGYETYAAVQIIDKDGNQVLTGIGAYMKKGAAHGEQAAIAALKRSLPNGTNLSGARMMVGVDQNPCEGCSSALDAFAEELGIAKMEVYVPNRPSLTNPAVDASAKQAARTAAMVGRTWKAKLVVTRTFRGTAGPSSAGGSSTEPPAAAEPSAVSEVKGEVGKGGVAGDAPAGQRAGTAHSAPSSKPVEVGTEISVNSTVQQANGTTISEIEYAFGKNLDQLNHGAPSGGEIPARITVRVTQNVDGAITAVESLSGEPQALVEALARQTLPEGFAGAAGGGARRLALLSKGLKFGGWAAFVVVTGYQLYKSTPERRPRVAAQAAGGLAGGALASYAVCNGLLDLETGGWGILICGLIVGGAAGYGSGELAGDIYDENTELGRALKRLDSRSRNTRVLFNLTVGQMRATGNCVDVDFINQFLSIAPKDLLDYEVIILASQMSSGAEPTVKTEAGVDKSAHESQTHAPSHEIPSVASQRGTVCPNCHSDNSKKDPTCSSAVASALHSLREAVAKLPPHHAAPSAVHPQHEQYVPGDTHSGSPAGPQPSRSLKDICPNCHQSMTSDKWHDLPAEFGGFGSRPGGQMSDADRQLLLDWLKSQPR